MEVSSVPLGPTEGAQPADTHVVGAKIEELPPADSMGMDGFDPELPTAPAAPPAFAEAALEDGASVMVLLWMYVRVVTAEIDTEGTEAAIPPVTDATADPGVRAIDRLTPGNAAVAEETTNRTEPDENIL